MSTFAFGLVLLAFRAARCPATIIGTTPRRGKWSDLQIKKRAVLIT
jgi:hypothetical protein